MKRASLKMAANGTRDADDSTEEDVRYCGTMSEEDVEEGLVEDVENLDLPVAL